VNLGKIKGVYELFSNYVGDTRALVISNLPVDGEPVWVRLMSYIDNEWQWIDH
jgi:hypothetical protein